MTAKKLKQTLPPATTRRNDGAAPRPITLEEAEPSRAGATKAGPKPKLGRPSKADLEERRQAEFLTEPQMRPTTGAVLRLLCLGLKGDAPTEGEVDLVNPAATAVANKYSMSTKWGPELALLGSLVFVVKCARDRKAATRGEQAMRSRDSRPQGIREDAALEAVPTGATA